MNSVAIIGGGITGLCAGYRLQELGVPVTVYEASPRVGGVIQTVEQDGFLAEVGPNTILETSPLISDLIRKLGLESERIYSDPAAAHRYVVRQGKPVRVPESIAGFLGTRLFSPAAKLRLGAEPFVRRGTDTEESVADFVRRRLGTEFLDYGVNPLIGGIYAGNPERLSLRYAFPRLLEVEQRYGSLLIGQVLGARERRRRKEKSKQNAPKFSFLHGLETLTKALQEKLTWAISFCSPIQKIRRTDKAWEVCLRSRDREIIREHSAILLAAPAHKLGSIAVEQGRFCENVSLGLLGKIHYAPVASLVLGFRREDIDHPLDGFGALVPELEHRNILGVIFSSSLFPNRAPSGHATLSCYLGGMRSPALATCSTQRAVECALTDLNAILGMRGRPVFVRHSIFAQAIPQYEIGFGRFKAFMNDLEVKMPGLFLAGHFRDGISLSDSIVAGHTAAHKIRHFVSGGGICAANEHPDAAALQERTKAITVENGEDFVPQPEEEEVFS
jgi:oxygen-dependent protoporphyrinogen oxidase